MACPNTGFCPAKVSIEHFNEFCMSEDNWRECKFYQEHRLTPAEWKRFINASEKATSTTSLNLTDSLL